jgi:hypothetical protein
MRAVLTQNELEFLSLKTLTLGAQLSEIVDSLESRLGETSELAIHAKNAESALVRFLYCVRRVTTIASHPATASMGNGNI